MIRFQAEDAMKMSIEIEIETRNEIEKV